MCKIQYFVPAVALTACRILVASEPPLATYDCAKTFPSNMSAADLRARFGAENVELGEIYLGEGEYEVGTILFPNDSSRRLEILWHDRPGSRFPRSVGVLNSDSSWRTPEGIGVGTDLKSVESRNARPFRLRGYGADGSGITRSWEGGRLGGIKECQLQLRLVYSYANDPEAESNYSLGRQLETDGVLSSGHPAFQRLNPKVDRMWLVYEPPNSALQRTDPP
jgi:hypothetical protein